MQKKTLFPRIAAAAVAAMLIAACGQPRQQEATSASNSMTGRPSTATIS